MYHAGLHLTLELAAWYLIKIDLNVIYRENNNNDINQRLIFGRPVKRLVEVVKDLPAQFRMVPILFRSMRSREAAVRRI